MTDRNKIQHTAAYKRCHELFAKNNLKPKLMRLDNEASTMLTDYLDSEDVIHQFFPQGCHPRNSAERAIHTFVNHFVAGLSSCVNNFPLNLWDKLLPQAILTLNLMRTSRMNPNLSAWAQVHRQYDFNQTPIGPPGTKIIIHEKAEGRPTFHSHRVLAWYVGPASKHYRCFNQNT